MMVWCQSYNVLVRVPTKRIDKWLVLDILRLIRNKEVDPMLTLVAVAHIEEMDWSEFQDEERFSYIHAQGMLVWRLGRGATVDWNAREGEGE